MCVVAHNAGSFSLLFIFCCMFMSQRIHWGCLGGFPVWTSVVISTSLNVLSLTSWCLCAHISIVHRPRNEWRLVFSKLDSCFVSCPVMPGFTTFVSLGHYCSRLVSSLAMTILSDFLFWLLSLLVSKFPLKYGCWLGGGISVVILCQCSTALTLSPVYINMLLWR